MMNLKEIVNKKASFDYEFIEKFEAGIMLTGNEIKSVRDGHMQLKSSYVVIENDEAYLVNCHIKHYDHGTVWNVDEMRRRKLLLNKREIRHLKQQLKLNRYTIVPISAYLKNGKLKLSIALARGKKLYDKRAALKEKEIAKKVEKFS